MVVDFDMRENEFYSAQGKQLRTIVVTGLGRASAKPDKAELRLGVSTQAATATEALTKNAESMNRVIETLKIMGILEKDIETSRFTLRPKYEPRREKLVGLEAVHILRVTTTNLDRVGEIIDKTVEAGANRIDVAIFTFKKEKLNELKKLARQRAVMDAKDKAETIANALGVKIVGIASAVEDVYPRAPRPGPEEAALVASMRVMPPTEVEIRVIVRVTFIIE